MQISFYKILARQYTFTIQKNFSQTFQAICAEGIAMKKVRYAIIIMFFALVACRQELTPAEKQMVSELKAELILVQNDIEETQAKDEKYVGGAIKALLAVHLEQAKITEIIIRQQIAAIETGAKVDIRLVQMTPDQALVAKLDKEIEDVKFEIRDAERELDKYSGGAIVSLIAVRIATHKMTLATLQQRRLAAKFGLNYPFYASTETEQVKSALIERPATEQIVGTPEEPEDLGPFDFRMTRWGMSMEQVEAAEKRDGLTPREYGDGGMIYNVEINTNNFGLLYQFTDDRLASANYILHENFTNKNNYIQIFERLKAQLTENYGKPINEKTVWNNSLFRNNPEDIGTAYSVGHVLSFAKWQTDSMDISAIIHGEKYKINVVVEYTSKEFGLELEKASKEKIKSQL